MKESFVITEEAKEHIRKTKAFIKLAPLNPNNHDRLENK